MTVLIENLKNPIKHEEIRSASSPLASSFSTKLTGWLWVADASGESASDPEREFQMEKAAFEEQLPILKGRFAGQYVAVHNGRVEEVAASEAEVVRRFFDRFHDTHVYIGYVGDTQPATYQVSPFGF